MPLVTIDFNPDRKKARSFCIILLCLSLLMLWLKSSHEIAKVVFIGTSLLGFCGILIPAIAKCAFVAVSIAVFPIGFIVSMVVLLIVYFLIFTPIGLIMRFMGMDPLKRRFDPTSKSYWIESDQQPVKRYFKQY